MKGKCTKNQLKEVKAITNNKMTEQETRRQFKRKVIELIHGKPYEEAIETEKVFGCGVKQLNSFYILNKKTIYGWQTVDGSYLVEYPIDEEYNKEELKITFLGLPITIGRVMQALHKKKDNSTNLHDDGEIYSFGEGPFTWRFTKEDGSECTDDDQDIKTIKKLLELF